MNKHIKVSTIILSELYPAKPIMPTFIKIYLPF